MGPVHTIRVHVMILGSILFVQFSSGLQGSDIMNNKNHIEDSRAETSRVEENSSILQPVTRLEALFGYKL